MKCVLCHAPIPEGLSECLECGASTSYGDSDGETSPDNGAIAQQPLLTQAAPQAQQSWEVLQTPTFQERRSSRTAFLSRKSFLFLSTITMVIIVVGSGLFLYLVRSNSTASTHLSPPGQINSTPSTQHFAGIAPTPVLTLTPATLSDPYPPYNGMLRINDLLQNNSSGFNWMDDTVSSNSENQGCRFIDGTYHIINSGMSRAYMIYCLALASNLSNFVYQIQATLLKGSDVGIVFRQAAHYRYYYFSIGQNGSYDLLWNDGTASRIITSGVSSAIHKGLNQLNILAVVANGTTLALYVNKQHLTSVTDNAYAEGRIGTAIQSDNGSASDATFSHLMLWT